MNAENYLSRFPELETTVLALADGLSQRALHMGTAESCTGGMIAAVCTTLAGSSNWFAGGITAYSNSVKNKLLNVPSSAIEKFGAVSIPVVNYMVMGALNALDVDCAVAISGIAGPDGGSTEKPVGTVCLAWAMRGWPSDAEHFEKKFIDEPMFQNSQGCSAQCLGMDEDKIILVSLSTNLINRPLALPGSDRHKVRIQGTLFALQGLLEFLD